MKKRSTCTHIHGSVYTDLKSEKNSKGKRFKEALSIYRTLHMYRQHVHKSWLTDMLDYLLVYWWRSLHFARNSGYLYNLGIVWIMVCHCELLPW